MKNEQRDAEIVRLWLERHPRGKGSMNDIFAFNEWLSQHRTDLLPSARYGDPYQQLKSVLRHYIAE